MSSAQEGVEHTAGPGKAVVHGQDCENIVRWSDVQYSLHHRRVAGKAAVGEDGALWCTSCTRGIDDDGGFLFMKIIRQWRCWRQGFPFPAAGDIQLLQAAMVILPGQGFFEIELLVGQDLVDGSIFQDIGDFAWAELEVDRDCNGTQGVDSHVRIDIAGTVA